MIDSGIKLGEMRTLFMSDLDLRATLPNRPNLPREIVRVPYGRDRVILMGGAEPVVLKSPRGYNELLRLLGALDGSSTLGEIINATEDSTKHSADALLDIVVALARAGLLEDGPRALEIDDPVASFLGRFAGSAQEGQHRAELTDMLAKAKVLCATTGLDGNSIRAALERSGIGTTISTWSPKGATAPITHALFILANGDDGLDDTILAVHEAGIPHFIVRIGADEAQVGPLVLPRVSAGYDCLVRAHAITYGKPDALRATFWGALAAHLFVLQITKLNIGYINQFVRYHEEPGAPREVVRIAMVPGSRTCAIAADPQYDCDPMLRTVWQHHMTVRRPPRSLMSPRAHLHHFTTANIARTRLEPERYHGVDTIDLPAPVLSGPVPWKNLVTKTETLDVQMLATILRTAAGYVDTDGRRRHVAPTGGGLESPTLFLLVQGINGLPDGGYRYYAPDHQLEVLPQLQWEMAKAALGTSDVRQCCIFSLCWFEKVRGKYSDFAYSIAHYDAGIVSVYAQMACRALGVDFVQYAELDTAVLSGALEFATSDNSYLPTSAFGIGEAVIQSGAEERPIHLLINEVRKPRAQRPYMATASRPELPILRGRNINQSIEELLVGRRSINAFRTGALSRDLLAEIIAVGSQTGLDIVNAGGLDVPVWPLLFHVEGTSELPSGVYVAHGVDPTLWEKRREGLDRHDLLQCINQLGLATASDIVFMIADVSAAVREYGSAGYRAALMRAGQTVSGMWLAAHAAGVASTAAGGVLEAGLSAIGGCDGYRECPMLSFAVGVAKADIP